MLAFGSILATTLGPCLLLLQALRRISRTSLIVVVVTGGFALLMEGNAQAKPLLFRYTVVTFESGQRKEFGTANLSLQDEPSVAMAIVSAGSAVDLGKMLSKISATDKKEDVHAAMIAMASSIRDNLAKHQGKLVVSIRLLNHDLTLMQGVIDIHNTVNPAPIERAAWANQEVIHLGLANTARKIEISCHRSDSPTVRGE